MVGQPGAFCIHGNLRVPPPDVRLYLGIMLVNNFWGKWHKGGGVPLHSHGPMEILGLQLPKNQVQLIIPSIPQFRKIPELHP